MLNLGMLKAVTWCAKCLFLYCIVAIVAIRYSWIFTTPVWQVAQRMHWTQLSRIAFILSYFLPIFAVSGFLIGLIPFGRLGKAIRDLFTALFPTVASKLSLEPDTVAPILWAWLPVTVAFLIRFTTWKSSSSSVLDPHGSTGHIERFFGTLNSQAPALVDNRWVSDRFIFTGPMLFLIASAIAVLIRHSLTAKRKAPVEAEPGSGLV